MRTTKILDTCLELAVGKTYISNVSQNARPFWLKIGGSHGVPACCRFSRTPTRAPGIPRSRRSHGRQSPRTDRRHHRRDEAGHTTGQGDKTPPRRPQQLTTSRTERRRPRGQKSPSGGDYTADDEIEALGAKVVLDVMEGGAHAGPQPRARHGPGEARPLRQGQRRRQLGPPPQQRPDRREGVLDDGS